MPSLMTAQDKVEANNLKRQGGSMTTAQHLRSAFCNVIESYLIVKPFVESYLIVIPDNFDSSMPKAETITSVSYFTKFRTMCFAKSSPRFIFINLYGSFRMGNNQTFKNTFKT